MFAFFQTSQNFPDHHLLSNTTASSLAMTLASSLKQSWLHPIWFHALEQIQFAYSVSSFFSIHCG